MLSLFVILIVSFFFITLIFIFSSSVINEYANSIMHCLTLHNILINNSSELA